MSVQGALRLRIPYKFVQNDCIEKLDVYVQGYSVFTKAAGWVHYIQPPLKNPRCPHLENR